MSSPPRHHPIGDVVLVLFTHFDSARALASWRLTFWRRGRWLHWLPLGWRLPLCGFLFLEFEVLCQDRMPIHEPSHAIIAMLLSVFFVQSAPLDVLQQLLATVIL